jgi:hypothetical protein
MRRALFVLFLMVAMGLGGIQVVAAASDQFVVLDPYDPRGINDHGDIVGFWTDAEGNIHGYLLSKGQFAEIQVPGTTITEVFGGNNRAMSSGSTKTRVGSCTGSY